MVIIKPTQRSSSGESKLKIIITIITKLSFKFFKGYYAG